MVLLSIAARALLWHWHAPSPAVPPGDPEEYYRAALHILHGGYYDTGKWLRPPAYPALLALLLPLAGMDVSGALLLQAALLGALGVLAFYALGRQLFGGRAGLLAALLAALYVPLADFGAALYAEALFVTLLALGLAALDRTLVSGRGRWALVTGLLLGLATLTRAVGLFFVPVAIAMLALRRTTHAERPTMNKGGTDRWSLVVCGLLGAALVIGPWAARNYAVHGRLILTDTNGGISMWYGAVRSPEEKAARDEVLFAVPNLADRQALALRWTAERALEDPAAFLGRARFKLASLFLLQTRSYAAGDLIAVGPDGAAVVQNAGELPLWLTLLADAQYILVMLLGIAGMALAPNPRRALPALLWVALAAGLAALTIGHPRLRLPIVAAFFPFAAYALLNARRWVMGHRRWAIDDGSATPRAHRPLPSAYRLIPLLAGWALFLALIASARYTAWLRGEWYALQARQQLAAANPAAARALLERARATDPSNALRTVALAELELAQGRDAAADALYARALELEGRNLYARGMRALLAARLGAPAVARAELAAIDAYWRARDDLHRWAWDHALAPPPARLVPGDPAALGHYAGFAPQTFDLPAGRWTLGDGRVRLAGGCGELVLRVQGPRGRTATVEVEGATTHVALTGAPQEIRLPLHSVPGCQDGPPIVVRVRSATGLLDLERAPWYAGVAVIEARVQPGGR
ncbi:MAG TPA: glycosyltransferase family 39 protein [Roseiflexaceae bacterium]|nr:glycosyltransferase family 39 protein [Roseiflexaceae bacterium]